MTTDLSPFPGTAKEYCDLSEVCIHNCTCPQGPQPCPAHSLLRNQHLLGHLMFARWLRGRLEAAEWDVKRDGPG